MTFLCAGRGAGVSRVLQQSAADTGVLQSVTGLRPGQTLQLEVDELRLDSTLTVAASDIVIRGRRGTTTVRCPATGGGFVMT